MKPNQCNSLNQSFIYIQFMIRQKKLHTLELVRGRGTFEFKQSQFKIRSVLWSICTNFSLWFVEFRLYGQVALKNRCKHAFWFHADMSTEYWHDNVHKLRFIFLLYRFFWMLPISSIVYWILILGCAICLG